VIVRPRSTSGAVAWLTVQALVFGAVAALLGIVANAMFLDAYGSAWLPVTYIATAAAGVAVSGALARMAQRFELIAIAVAVLAAATAGLLLSWIVARQDASWVSAPLLVLFPILLQLGFVFIGGQASRLLDIAGIKTRFPRIMAGFPVGAVLGGLIAGQLVGRLGTTEDLLLVTAVAEAAFAALVLVTGLRYAGHLSPLRPEVVATPSTDDAGPTARPPLRQLLGGFVALILGYQVLSALGSQLADFLVYDRAVAYYSTAEDLARFLALYTAVMNAVSILFLVAVAGPLLRRFGLRLGIAANPLVVTILAVGMLAALAIGGGGSVLLLVTVSAARIADVALSDGTTRTSINAAYQVLSERSRLPVQTTVEGIGVPVAIGVSGVLILVIQVLPFALLATIGVTTLVCAAWSWSAIRLYRGYGPALVDALRRRPLLVPAAGIDGTPEDEALARRLLSGEDAAETRLGVELLARMSPARDVELARLAEDPRPDVRVAALAALAGSGDEAARRRLAVQLAAMLEGDASPPSRLRAARAVSALAGDDRAAFAGLLEDEDAGVRSAALDAVQVGDAFALAPALAALEDAATVDAAAGAIGRLGDAVVPTLAEWLDAAGSTAPVATLRLVRAAATATVARDVVLTRHVQAPDRELAVVVTERLICPEPAPSPVTGVLVGGLDDAVRHADRILAVLAVLEAALEGRGRELPLHRALEEELDLLRRHVRALVLVRHGSARLGTVLTDLASPGPRRSLAREALEVLLTPAERMRVLAVLDPGRPAPERLRPLSPPSVADQVELVDGLRDLAADADDHWRSTWLCACAVHAAAALRLLDRIDAATARARGGGMVDELLAASLPR
jgi:hypothetical protein